MSNQLSFELHEIDNKATRKAVEKALEKYRMYLLMEDIQPKITQMFSIVPPTYDTNAFHSSTEDVAIQNAERLRYIKRIQRIVNNGLTLQERAIIIRRYMQSESTFDYQVYNELNTSERTYHRVKTSAFYKLALALRITVYRTEEVAS